MRPACSVGSERFPPENQLSNSRHHEVMNHNVDRDTRGDRCLFCDIVTGRMPCDKVADDATTLAFMDIDPGSDGHLLIIPKQHSADLLSVSPEDLTATTLAAQRVHDELWRVSTSRTDACPPG